MATIEISDLHPAGSDLFIDSESFLNDLNADELGDINGGGTPAAATTVTTSTAFCASAVISASAVIGGFYLVTKL